MASHVACRVCRRLSSPPPLSLFIFSCLSLSSSFSLVFLCWTTLSRWTTSSSIWNSLTYFFYFCCYTHTNKHTHIHIHIYYIYLNYIYIDLLYLFDICCHRFGILNSDSAGFQLHCKLPSLGYPQSPYPLFPSSLHSPLLPLSLSLLFLGNTSKYTFI